MRPIDADALKRGIEVICKDERASISAVTYFALMAFINKAPTIDHRDLIVKGEWLECDYKTFEHGEIETHYGKGLYCSLCRCGFKKDELKYRNFCPSCGAKMDGGAD